MDHDKFSPEAQAVWDELDEGTKKNIQKENPFRQERNMAICTLRERGVKIILLKELTGLGKQQLDKIVPTKKRSKAADADRANQVLNDLRTSLEAFFNSVSTIINSTQEKGGEKIK